MTLSDRLEGISVDLLFPAFVSGAALLAASLLGTFKPWGSTPFGRRRRSSIPPAAPPPLPNSHAARRG